MAILGQRATAASFLAVGVLVVYAFLHLTFNAENIHVNYDVADEKSAPPPETIEVPEKVEIPLQEPPQEPLPEPQEYQSLDASVQVTASQCEECRQWKLRDIAWKEARTHRLSRLNFSVYHGIHDSRNLLV